MIFRIPSLPDLTQYVLPICMVMPPSTGFVAFRHVSYMILCMLGTYPDMLVIANSTFTISNVAWATHRPCGHVVWMNYISYDFEMDDTIILPELSDIPRDQTSCYVTGHQIQADSTKVDFICAGYPDSDVINSVIFEFNQNNSSTSILIDCGKPSSPCSQTDCWCVTVQFKHNQMDNSTMGQILSQSIHNCDRIEVYEKSLTAGLRNIHELGLGDVSIA